MVLNLEGVYHRLKQCGLIKQSQLKFLIGWKWA